MLIACPHYPCIQSPPTLWWSWDFGYVSVPMREVSLIQGCLLRAFSKSQLVCWSTLLGSGKLGYTACEASSFKYPGQEAYSVKYLTTILRRYIIGSVCNAESRATCTRRWNIGYQYMLDNSANSVCLNKLHVATCAALNLVCPHKATPPRNTPC